jgi:hypothetical protein
VDVEADVDVVVVSEASVDGGIARVVEETVESPPMQPHSKTSPTKNTNERIKLTIELKYNKIITSNGSTKVKGEIFFRCSHLGFNTPRQQISCYGRGNAWLPAVSGG